MQFTVTVGVTVFSTPSQPRAVWNYSMFDWWKFLFLAPILYSVLIPPYIEGAFYSTIPIQESSGLLFFCSNCSLANVKLFRPLGDLFFLMQQILVKAVAAGWGVFCIIITQTGLVRTKKQDNHIKKWHLHLHWENPQLLVGGLCHWKNYHVPVMLPQENWKRILLWFCKRHQGSIICHIQWKAEVLSECMNCANLVLTDYLKIMKLGLVLMMKFF